MKIPAIPYPNPGIQHTRCVVALTMIKSCLEIFRPAEDENASLRTHMGKIQRWIEVCSEQTRRKKLSSGAKRSLDKCFIALSRHMLTEEMDDEARFHRWAALLWAALTFVEDACNTCPLYAKERQWRYLRQTINTLAEKLREIEPGMDEDGTKIYEDGALQ